MKEIREKLIPLLKEGSCTPQISVLAKRLKEPTTTLQYNIKKMEEEKTILAYKAVFDYKKIDQGFCSYILLHLSNDEYAEPEQIGKELAKHPEIESIDIITGDWEMIIKVRTKDQDSYYEFMKKVISRKKVSRVKTFTALKQIKSEFVRLN